MFENSLLLTPEVGIGRYSSRSEGGHAKQFTPAMCAFMQKVCRPQMCSCPQKPDAAQITLSSQVDTGAVNDMLAEESWY